LCLSEFLHPNGTKKRETIKNNSHENKSIFIRCLPQVHHVDIHSGKSVLFAQGLIKKIIRKAKLSETRGVKQIKRTLPDLNKFAMKNAPDWTHAVLQRMIVIFLGLLTLGVALNSCTTQSHSTCAAYDRVEVRK
jgi:hypothetical protein